MCPSSDAYHLYDDGHGYCFSCRSYIPPGKEDHSVYTYEYLPQWNISADTLRFYDVLTKIDSDGRPLSIGFVYPNKDTLVRLLDRKEFFWVKSGSQDKPGLFGRDRFSAGSSKYVTITEGAKDACSLYEALGQGHPVVACTSAASAVGDCTVDRSWLDAYERIYLCFDGDAAGREATRNVARLFRPDKVYHVKLTKRKDANEFLEHGEGEELRHLWWNSKQYLPETITSSLSDFRKTLEVPLQKGIPYPFKCLTDMTYGIRTGETVLITAQEKVGKTELMHAIERQLLKETEDNVAAIFLEEPQQRHLLALAGLEQRQPIHLPDHSCPVDQTMDTLRKLFKKDDRLFVYNHYGSDDPTVFLDTIRYLVTACSCRYVLLDHISMVISGLAGASDERKQLDYFSTRLEMMVKELDFALIMVSHVNDEGKTRGSRYLTKVSDITISLDRDLMHPDADIRNVLRLSVPYNRYCSHTGYSGSVYFDPDTYSYQELSNDEQTMGLRNSTNYIPMQSLPTNIHSKDVGNS